MKPIMPSAHSELARMSWMLSGLGLLFVLIWLAPALYAVQGLASYLPVHMFAETFSIVVAMLVFGVAWNAYNTERPGNIIILACALFAVALIDFSHMLSFKGMPDFVTPSGPEKAINLWLSARLVAALALLVVALRPWRPLVDPRSRYWLLTGILAVAIAVSWLGVVHPEVWPRTFIAGRGLTPFKIGAEYAIVAILLVPAVLFYLQASRSGSDEAVSLFAATIITILSELSFTLYSDVADIFNLLGHLYKIVAYFFIYRAVFVASVREPFRRLDAEFAENRRIARELRAVSSYTRSLIEASLDPFVTISAEGKITDVNHATEQATGRTRTELVGTDFSDYFTESDKAREGYRQVFALGYVTDYPLALRHRDGRVTDVLYNASVYRNEAGDVLGVFAAARDITERKRADAARMQLAAIVESSSDAIIGKTKDGIIVSWNKGAEKIYGYTAEEVMGKPVTMLALPARHAEIHEFLEKIRKGEDVANYESERVRKDGTLIQVALTLSPIRGADGKIAGISTIARDITEKKRLEEELHRASVYNRSLIEASLDPLVTINVDGKITDVNHATEKATGRSRTELIGTDFSDYFTEPDKARDGYQQVFARGYATDYPLALRHRDGHVTDVLYNASVYRDEKGEVLGVFAAARDVTERNRAEQELAQLSLRNRLILDSVGEGIYGLDIEGRCTFVNPAAVRLLGFSAEELVGQRVHQKFHHTRPDGSSYPEEECPMHVSYKGGESHRGDDLYWRKDGSSFPVEFTSTPILDAGKVTGAVATFRDITERKKAEFVLRQSEEALKEAQRIAHLGSWYMDLETNEVFWSEELYRMYGFDPALPPPLFTESMKLFTPESWERLSAAIAQVRETGIPYEIELEAVTKDGTRGWMLARGELVRDAQGAAVRVRGVVMDITGRKQAEERLRRSEHGLSEAQRIAHLGNWELDLENDLLTWSDEIYRIFEIDPTKFGASYEAFLNAIHPDDREMVNKAYTDSVADKVPYDIVHRLQMPDGRIKYVNEKCETHYGPDGKPFRSVGTVHDITERMLDEMALLRVNRELRAISNCNQVLMRSRDERALLEEICRIVCEDAGYRMAWVGYAENDEGKTIRLISRAGVEDGYLQQARLTWGDTERGRGPSGIAIREGVSVTIQDFDTDPKAVPWRDAALQRGYRSSISLPLKDESARTFGILNIYSAMPNAFTPEEIRLLEELAGDMAFGIMVLRTRIERQHAEEELRMLNQELEQRVVERTSQLETANRELEAFSYSVSHDLRAPLRAIDGFSRILLDDYRDRLDEEGKRLLNVVRDNTIRMGQLIDDILKFSRAGRTELAFSEIDMEKLAHSVFTELRPDVAEGKLLVEIEPIPPARGDSAMMRQVFVNLLSNAIKFSRNRDPARIRVGASAGKDEVVYYVADNGAGFDMQFADKLFGVFQRLHGVAEFEGTGIGLAIVKRIVTRHGGRVWAEGKVNEGATVYFSLPTRQAEPE